MDNPGIICDWLNLLAIETLEALGNDRPTQKQIDIIESLLNSTIFDLTQVNIWRETKRIKLIAANN